MDLFDQKLTKALVLLETRSLDELGNAYDLLNWKPEEVLAAAKPIIAKWVNRYSGPAWTRVARHRDVAVDDLEQLGRAGVVMALKRLRQNQVADYRSALSLLWWAVGSAMANGIKSIAGPSMRGDAAGPHVFGAKTGLYLPMTLPHSGRDVDDFKQRHNLTKTFKGGTTKTAGTPGIRVKSGGAGGLAEIPDRNAEWQHDIADTDELKALLVQAARRRLLSPREAQIISAFGGLTDRQYGTKAEFAKALGVSPSRFAQLQSSAFNKLKKLATDLGMNECVDLLDTMIID